MADNLSVKDANAAAQTLGAKEYGGVKYPQIVDWTAARILSAASTNATSVKASAATLAAINVVNTNAAARYLKLYNKASAPTVGTDTPLATIILPGGGVPREISIPGGLSFPLGLAYALTTGVADSDTAAVAANEITGLLAYK